MAQKIVTTLEDDLDGSEASGTHTLSLNGRTVSIDLNDKNFAKLSKAVQPYLDAGKKVAGPQKARGPVSANKERNTAIRAWAAEQGIDLAKRGAISKKTQDAYDLAMKAKG